MNVLHPSCARLPGWLPPVSGGGLKMAWLASAYSSIHARCTKKVRQRDLMVDESGDWPVVQYF